MYLLSFSTEAILMNNGRHHTIVDHTLSILNCHAVMLSCGPISHRVRSKYIDHKTRIGFM